MKELEQLEISCERIEELMEKLVHLDPLEYERAQKFISSKYGVDLPLKQPE